MFFQKFVVIKITVALDSVTMRGKTVFVSFLFNMVLHSGSGCILVLAQAIIQISSTKLARFNSKVEIITRILLKQKIALCMWIRALTSRF